MNFEPTTTIHLLGGQGVSLLTNSYKNELYFPNVTAQTTFFLSKIRHSMDKATYQRKNINVVAYAGQADDLWDVNYLMFQNSNFGNKWFYAFITSIDYINPSLTYITYEIDAFQTWMFDITFQQSFVEREHQTRYNADGTPVINTIDEGLNYGSEYAIVSDKSYKFYGNTVFILIGAKDYIHKPPTGVNRPAPPHVGNVANGLYWYLLPFGLDGTNQYYYGNGQPLLPFQMFYSLIQTSEVLVNKVVSLSIVDYVPLNAQFSASDPQTITSMQHVSTANVREDLGLTGNLIVLENGAYINTTIDCGNKYADFPNYKESKLLMYPYSYTKVTDLKGNEINLKNEYIENTNLVLNVEGSLGQRPKTAYVVQNYLDDTNLLSSVMNTSDANIPIIDDYTASYLQSNRNSLIASTAFGLGNTISGALSNASNGNYGGVVDSAMDGFERITMLNAKFKDIDNVPPNLRNMGNDANFDYGQWYQGIRVIKYTVQSEYYEILSDYFKMYGTKRNRVKIPNLHTRKYWNYVKTVNANISGNIPLDDMNTIKTMFDRGTTLWHTPDVGNYSLDNVEI